MVPEEGVEPTLSKRELDFESSAFYSLMKYKISYVKFGVYIVSITHLNWDK